MTIFIFCVCEREREGPFLTCAGKLSCALCGSFLNLLLCLLLLLVISPLLGAQASDRDGEENCPAYERTGLLLAYEIMSLINGLQPHYHSASAGL